MMDFGFSTSITSVVGRYTTFRLSSICVCLLRLHCLQPAHNAMSMASPASIATPPRKYVIYSGFLFVQCFLCSNVDKIFLTFTTCFSSLSISLNNWLISWVPMICNVFLMSNVFLTFTADLNTPALQTHPCGFYRAHP